jgi:hypothetical protein
VPQGVVVDGSGNVWITNRGTDPGIAVFPSGEAEPSEYRTNGLIKKPIEDFFDGNGNLYFSEASTGVSEIPRGSEQPTSLGLQGLNQANGVALAPSGNLYVGDYENGPHVVRVYALGEEKPKHNLVGNEGSYYIAWQHTLQQLYLCWRLVIVASFCLQRRSKALVLCHRHAWRQRWRRGFQACGRPVGVRLDSSAMWQLRMQSMEDHG